MKQIEEYFPRELLERFGASVAEAGVHAEAAVAEVLRPEEQHRRCADEVPQIGNLAVREHPKFCDSPATGHFHR